jgi:hypothetical protein
MTMPATITAGEAFAARYFLTSHARERMAERRISESLIRRTLQCGRVHKREGALLYIVGREEIERYRPEGVDLSKCDGVHVVCDTAGRVITTYRNRHRHESSFHGSIVRDRSRRH